MKYFKFTCVSFLLISMCSCSKSGLEIEDNEEIKLIQRGTKIIEGSEGPVELKIGDITFGSTEVFVTGMDNSKIYFQNYMSVGDKETFEYAGLFYEIRVNSFEEHLLHDDYAFISMRTVSEEIKSNENVVIDNTSISKDEINGYFDKIEQSDLSFLRNGEPWSGLDFSSHLEAKYLINETEIKTKTDFKEKVIQSSSESGQPYEVISETGDTIQLTDWLGL